MKTPGYNYARDLYPVATSGSSVMFFDAAYGSAKPDNRGETNMVIVDGDNVMDGSFIAYVTRPHDFKPIRGNKFAEFLFSFDSRNGDPTDWEKVVHLGKAGLATKYAKATPKKWSATVNTREALDRFKQFGLPAPRHNAEGMIG